jgi:hypothetical protein
MATKIRLCEVCKKPIEAGRLETDAYTRLCKEHAEQIGQYGGEFIMTTTRERTSKAGSLKQNYGGVNVSRKRNQTAIERLKDAYERERWERRAGGPIGQSQE